MSNIQDKEPSDSLEEAYLRLKKTNKLKFGFLNLSALLFIIAFVIGIIWLIGKI